MKKFLFFTFLFLLQNSFSQFITTWKTDNPGTSNNYQLTIPTTGSSYDYIVDWGDGSIDSAVIGEITHTYSTIDTFTVSITGDFSRIYFNNDGDKEKILSVEQWGANVWSSMESAFFGASNLEINATDAPNLSNVTDMSHMFSWISSFNQDIGAWDVSNVTNMEGMFYGASSFNQDIGNWDVSNVTSMKRMFGSTDLFNQDIGNWDVGNVTNMRDMFQSADLFNQNIGGWNVSNVTNMMQMFSIVDSFNQDIGNWDVSNVTDMDGMFFAAESFDQNLGDWDITNVTTMNSMFAGIMLSSSNYDSLLIGWNNQELNGDVEFDGGDSKFCTSEAIEARDNLISSFNWDIWDAGQDTTCIPVGIEEDNIVDFTVSPNPASNLLEIRLSKMVDGAVSLADFSGRILDNRILENGINMCSIDVSGYASGIYLVEIKSKGIKIKSEKLIIQ